MTIEDIILQQGQRGMDLLRPYLAADFCREAAQSLYKLPRGKIILTTGFYVAGAAESDGPPGTAVLAKVLEALGFSCTIITDKLCLKLFEPLGLDTIYWEDTAHDPAALLKEEQPVALISIERCGENDLHMYGNSRGKDIAPYTAPLDRLFLEAQTQHIPTLGIGDGGNEIGMGNLQEIISQKLALHPCIIAVDKLIIATVSNWGAYGLAACLGALAHKDLLPQEEWLEKYLVSLAAAGCVDGITCLATPTVDGFPDGTEKSIYQEIHNWELAAIKEEDHEAI